MNRLSGSQPKTLASELADAERVIAHLASHVIGTPVQVMFSSRVSVPVTLQVSTGTVVVDPVQTSLSDVLEAAALLQRRAEIREACGNFGTLPATLAAEWMAAARREVHRRLPKLAESMTDWRSWCRDGDPLRTPKIVWETVPLDALSADDGVQSLSWQPDISFSGTEGDWNLILAQISSGKIPSRSISGFPLPIVTVPFCFECPTASGADLEQYETMSRGLLSTQKEWLQCYHRTSCDDYWSSLDLRRFSHGKHLDETRLALAAAHAMEGRPARVFHRWRSASNQIFEPSEHLLAVGIDFNPAAGSTTLSDAVYRRAIGRTHLRVDSIAMMLNLYRTLRARVSITGFFDRVIAVAGRPHYLHLPMHIKAPDEPWHGACLNRLASLLIGRSVRLPGKPAMLLPATLETVEARIKSALKADRPRHLRVFGMFSTGLPQSEKTLRPVAVTSHVAAAAEAVLVRWHREWAEMHFACESTYVPPEIKAAAVPGMQLHRLLTV